MCRFIFSISYPVKRGGGSIYREKFGREARPLSLVFLSISELGVPRPCGFCKGGHVAADSIRLSMPADLHRTYGAHHLLFITSSCYHRLPFLDVPSARDRVLAILEQTRQKYRFVVVG